MTDSKNKNAQPRSLELAGELLHSTSLQCLRLLSVADVLMREVRDNAVPPLNHTAIHQLEGIQGQLGEIGHALMQDYYEYEELREQHPSAVWQQSEALCLRLKAYREPAVDAYESGLNLADMEQRLRAWRTQVAQGTQTTGEETEARGTARIAADIAAGVGITLLLLFVVGPALDFGAFREGWEQTALNDALATLQNTPPEHIEWMARESASSVLLNRLLEIAPHYVQGQTEIPRILQEAYSSASNSFSYWMNIMGEAAAMALSVVLPVVAVGGGVSYTRLPFQAVDWGMEKLHGALDNAQWAWLAHQAEARIAPQDKENPIGALYEVLDKRKNPANDLTDGASREEGTGESYVPKAKRSGGGNALG